MQGTRSRWTQEHELLAGILDQIRAANWQRSGGKGARPKPTPRPGAGGRRIGTALPVEAMREILDDWSEN